VTDTATPALPAAPTPGAPELAPSPPATPLPDALPRQPVDHTRWFAAAAVLLAVLATAALVFAWNTQQRVKALEVELVKRQQESGSQAGEARTLARQAEAVAREAAAKVALLDARVAETSMQRSQFEDLVQSLARSRDENVLADIESAVRVALQQSAITGSAEPLVATLKQADDRLARYNQPRLERVRRAVAQDLERTRAAGVADIGVLTLRLDEVIRNVDDLVLLSHAERRAQRGAPGASDAAQTVDAAASAASASWGGVLGERGRFLLLTLWQEVKSLVRVTRIDEPDAMLLAPDQAFFLRENLKLRLLNARLALLSRQFDTAQLDLRDAQASLDRYFDRSARRVQLAADTLKQLSTQARVVGVPRPDATLAAIATASAGR
jgi:uroporphyrin-3 C-methyltransferase